MVELLHTCTFFFSSSSHPTPWRRLVQAEKPLSLPRASGTIPCFAMHDFMSSESGSLQNDWRKKERRKDRLDEIVLNAGNESSGKGVGGLARVNPPWPHLGQNVGVEETERHTSRVTAQPEWTVQRLLAANLRSSVWLWNNSRLKWSHLAVGVGTESWFLWRQTDSIMCRRAVSGSTIASEHEAGEAE